MKKIILNLLKIITGLYLVLCGLLYCFQEKIIFQPTNLDKNYQFNFSQNFKELNFKTSDGKQLNGLLFKAENSKGIIFYLHGNAGALNSWGNVATTYTDLNYDVLILDYRSYGKSEGTINNQHQLFEDNQIVYNTLMEEYNENEIIVLGYSIGTGLASKLASNNNPKHLILQAPYYNLSDVMKKTISFIPSFILKYKFETNEYLKNCNMPITIFHGTEDTVIAYESSLKLKKDFPTIRLISLEGQGHNGITYNQLYKNELMVLLNK